MLKKLQALKAKKGFTLVELIVVIAIIAVLAAILVPTLLGQVTKANVSSANSTAKSIQDIVTNFLTEADTKGYGMKNSATTLQTLVITVDGGTWKNTSTIDATKFKSSDSRDWTTAAPTGGVTASTDVTTIGKSAVGLLLQTLATSFPDLKQACIAVSLRGNANCVAVAYTADEKDAAKFTAGTDYPSFDTTTGSFPATFKWDTHTAGISSNGLVVGTSPAVDIGGTATP